MVKLLSILILFLTCVCSYSGHPHHDYQLGQLPIRIWRGANLLWLRQCMGGHGPITWNDKIPDPLVYFDPKKLKIKPYCTEHCPPGYRFISGLNKCYAIMLNIGPVPFEMARQACGMFFGGQLPTIDENKPMLIEKLRNIFWKDYGEDCILKMNATRYGWRQFREHQGFWMGYKRPCMEWQIGQVKDGKPSEPLRKDPFNYYNIYTKADLPPKYWRRFKGKKQPADDNPFGPEESCTVRKRFHKKFTSTKKNGIKFGLIDDFSCTHFHWAICEIPLPLIGQTRCENPMFNQGHCPQNNKEPCTPSFAAQCNFDRFQRKKPACQCKNEYYFDPYGNIFWKKSSMKKKLKNLLPKFA